MTFAEIVAVLGGWSVITIGVSAFVGKLVSERIFSKWRTDEQRQIETLRSALADNRLLIEASLSSMACGQNETQQKRLSSVERLWAAILELREKFSGTVFFYSILLPSEYMDSINKGGALAASVSKLDKDTISKAMASSEGLETYRPYLGELLWVKFFVYRAFLGRISYLIVSGKDRGHIIDWREDPGVKQILQNILSKDEFQKIITAKQNPSAINWAIQEIEGQILRDINVIITGKSASQESFEIARQLQNAVAELNKIKA